MKMGFPPYKFIFILKVLIRIKLSVLLSFSEFPNESRNLKCEETIKINETEKKRKRKGYFRKWMSKKG